MLPPPPCFQCPNGQEQEERDEADVVHHVFGVDDAAVEIVEMGFEADFAYDR